MQPGATRIDGATRLLVIVGDPIEQVRSPITFNQRLAEIGSRHVMLPWHAPEAAFAPVIAGLLKTGNLDGIVVTYPFKAQALAWVDTVAPRAALVGATNAIRREADGRWTADMFDGVGLVRAVASIGESVAGRSIKLLGAGGAGSAIAFALADAGARSLSIHDLDTAKAARLAAKVTAHTHGCQAISDGPALGDVSLLINATPVGLAADDPTPVPVTELTAATTVIDIVTRPGGTRLLGQARAIGCPHTGGAAMVEGQRDAMLEFFGLATPPGTERIA
jgi:shikimate dehydrogenase